MPRPYDSTRRRAQARETRRRILDAAVALHARGVMELGELARAAGVPLPTVRKHFPTKEHVFEGCTAHFLETFEPPDLEPAAPLRCARTRASRVVAELARAHEATHALLWHALPHSAGSPALTAAQAQYGQLVELAVEVVLGGDGLEGLDRDRTRPRLRALLDTLTYRALRVSAGLCEADARAALSDLVLCAIGLTSRSS